MVNQTLVKTSYSKDDVQILLKDLTGSMEALDTHEREKMIQSGIHYSEMLPLEYKPTQDYMDIYNKSLRSMSKKTALGVAVLASNLYLKHGMKMVIVSLARAGIPIGILVKKYIEQKFEADIPHYSISIIRGKGIDTNAMEYIYSKHKQNGVEHFQFLDGWTGKGAINNQLSAAVNELKADSKWEKLSADLAVLADPANVCKQCGTREDFLIPSACLNGTVSGLVSRTIMRNDLINVADGEFHGGVYFENLENEDRSIEFINTVEDELKQLTVREVYDAMAKVDGGKTSKFKGISFIESLAHEFGIADINLIKPGVGETTRVLLRRLPWKVLVDETHSNTEGIEHIIRLCNEKNIPVESYKLGNYKACGIIKDLSADA